MNIIEILKSREIYPGYPSLNQRTEMGKIRYQEWVHNGRRTGVAFKLHDHPKYLRGLGLGTATQDDFGKGNVHDITFAPSFTGDYEHDAAGRPVHPFAEQLFAAGLAIEGPGAYWTYGPNLCADPVVLGLSKDGRLKTIVITRGDTGTIAFPGGHCNLGENPMFTAARELEEETGVALLVNDLCLVDCVYQGIVADPRTTLNAWPETSVFVFVVKPRVIDAFRPKGQDDAASAAVVPVDETLYRSISKMHVEYLRLAVEFYEKTFS